jgi:hypothetical protein
MTIAIVIVLLDEATLGSKPRWKSYNASRRGDSKAKGYGTNATNLEPNNALYLKFERSFGGVMMHKINLQNLNKIIFIQKNNNNNKKIFVKLRLI